MPLADADERHLSYTDASDLLAGLTFHSPTERHAAVGIALEYRLVFEREWHLPADASPDRLIDEMLQFLREALDTAM